MKLILSVFLLSLIPPHIDAAAEKKYSIILDAYSDGIRAWSVHTVVNARACTLNGSKLDECDSFRDLASQVLAVPQNAQIPDLRRLPHPDGDYVYLLTVNGKRSVVALEAPGVCTVMQDGSQSCKKNTLSSAQQLLLKLRQGRSSLIKR